MSKSTPAIRGVKARAVVVPLKRPVKNAFGIFTTGPLVLIEVLGRELVGKPIVPFDLMAAMDAKFRLLGWQGLVGMAVSGLDMAYWDALGQLANKSVVELLGGSPKPIRAYDSYGVVDP